MLCDLCHKNDAYIYIEKSFSDGKKRICLCITCASSHGIVASKVSCSEQSVESVFNDFIEKNEEYNPLSKKLCPGCGRSLFDIKKYWKTGCPECYCVFANEIKEEMAKKSIKVQWKGSFPKRLKGFRSNITDRNDIQMKMNEAVAMENYEKAAVYRDFLRALERGAVFDGNYEDETEIKENNNKKDN